jgi:hypothetical protein
MDISKLPRLSQTSQPAEAGTPAEPGSGTPVATTPPASGTTWCTRCNAPNPAGTRYCGNCAAPMGMRDVPRTEAGIEAWLSIGLGILLLLMNTRLLRYLSHVCFGTYFAPYEMPDGTVVAYTAQLDFWSDLGITLFAVVLILDGVVLVISRKPWIIAAALTLTVAATFYNLCYLVMTFTRAGLAIMSAFAMIFGVYIALYQWRIWNTVRVRREA